MINNINYESRTQQIEVENLLGLYNLLNTINPDSLSIENTNELLNLEADGGIAGAYARDILIVNNIIGYNEPVYLPNLMINRKTEAFSIAPESKYLKVYPNPASDYIYVDYKLPEEFSNIMLKIINVKGVVLKNIVLKYTIDNTLIKLSGLISGTYIIVLQADGKIIDTANITIVK